MLVIDDKVDQALSMAAVLDILGHEVRTAFGGRQGLDEARAFRPEVLLCDLGMPVVDGFMVARTLRSDRELRAVRLIAVSAYDMPGVSVDAGFDVHLVKPADVRELALIVAAEDAAWDAQVASAPATRPRGVA
ncbi:MAG TPA: response regulator [Vicinamibacteria bacterium]|nr:response regulator [Vicinamibacteria bacterium]